MKRKSRIWTAAVLLLILFTLAGSVFVILHTAEHDCIGEGCPVCTAIAASRDHLRSAGNLQAALIFALLLFAAALWCLAFGILPTDAKTPVFLKVKLTN